VVIEGGTKQEFVLWEDLLFELIKSADVALGLFQGKVALHVFFGAVAFGVAGVPNRMGLVGHVAYEPDLPLIRWFKEGVFGSVNKLKMGPLGSEFASEEVITSDGVLLLAEEYVWVVGYGFGGWYVGITVRIKGVKGRVRWVSTMRMVSRSVGQMRVKRSDEGDTRWGVVVRVV
jgi:hypothetical protein